MKKQEQTSHRRREQGSPQKLSLCTLKAILSVTQTFEKLMMSSWRHEKVNLRFFLIHILYPLKIALFFYQVALDVLFHNIDSVFGVTVKCDIIK